MTDYLREQIAGLRDQANTDLTNSHASHPEIAKYPRYELATDCYDGNCSGHTARLDDLEIALELLDQVRCDNCVHWTRVSIPSNREWGQCDSPMTLIRTVGRAEYHLHPNADFYCAAFQPKESE